MNITEQLESTLKVQQLYNHVRGEENLNVQESVRKLVSNAKLYSMHGECEEKNKGKVRKTEYTTYLNLIPSAGWVLSKQQWSLLPILP